MESDSEHGIVIEPPEIHDLTDEDFSDENLEGEYNVDKLSCRQLLAPTELHSQKKHLEDDPTDETSLEISSNQKEKQKGTAKITSTTDQKIKKQINWIKKKTPTHCEIFPEKNYSCYKNFSLIETGQKSYSISTVHQLSHCSALINQSDSYCPFSVYNSKHFDCTSTKHPAHQTPCKLGASHHIGSAALSAKPISRANPCSKGTDLFSQLPCPFS